MHTYEELICKLKAEPGYIARAQFGKPRKGHEEGSVQKHIEQLEDNLYLLIDNKVLTERLVIGRLEFAIVLHDLFKKDQFECTGRLSIRDDNHHASLARDKAVDFFGYSSHRAMIKRCVLGKWQDIYDLFEVCQLQSVRGIPKPYDTMNDFYDDMNFIYVMQYHDEPYACFRAFKRDGDTPKVRKRLDKFLNNMKMFEDYHLAEYLIFNFIDNLVPSKEGHAVDWLWRKVNDKNLLSKEEKAYVEKAYNVLKSKHKGK